MASSNNDRIIVLVDMDCFFCQVETKLHPEFAGKPLAVVQYNQWKLGGIIAVNYEAREYGVTRHMRGEEGKEKCPDLLLASVPCLRGKADTSKYRNAGRQVIEVIRKHCNLVERASVDEAYLDITDIVNERMSTNSIAPNDLVTQLSNTFIVGYSEIGKNDENERRKGIKTWMSHSFESHDDIQAQKLAIAGKIVEDLRADIFEQTGYRCSAGISQNKILAKLACGLHKPNRQTILPANAVSELYSTLPVKKVRNLGGKFGDVVVESLNCNVMGDLLRYPLQYLQKRFDEKTGLWLYNIARGVDNEPVTMRLVSKSIGACKKFPGRQAIVSLDVLRHWAGEMSAEVCERLEQDFEENKRRATLLTICYHYYQNKTVVSQSRSCALTSYKPEAMTSRCVDIISKSTQCPVAYVGISVGKFVQAKGSENFRNFFKSSKLNGHEKITVQIENTKVEHHTKETVINNLNRNENTKISIKKNVKASVHLSERAPNTNTDWSPTSRKLNNLINSLNEPKKGKSFREKKLKKSSLNDSWDKDEFKESFFMNILNPKETKLEGEIEIIEFDKNSKNIDIECESINENKGDENDYNMLTDNFHTNEEDSDFGTRDIVNGKRKSCSDSEFDLDSEQSNSKKIIRNDTGEQSTSSNVVVDEKAINFQNSIKLEEIFPDLNNIDPSVVALLPSNLQEEAKLYMKTHKNCAQSKKCSSKGASVKSSKAKSKPKANSSKEKKSNDMYSFLVKKDSRNFIDVPSKQCPQCYQMIPVLRYDEHCDFHVAENLQRELNNPTLQTVN